jgi:hypothetical protein
VVLAIGGTGIIACCILPCGVGMVLPGPDPAVVKAERERREARAKANAEEQERKAKAAALERQAQEEKDKKIEAWTMAEKFITDRLKSPSTASFGKVLSGTYQDPTTCVTKLEDGDYLARGWVDSQNAYGATVRVHFTAQVRDHGDGKWSLVEEPTMVQR